jgi:hypothetical protein
LPSRLCDHSLRTGGGIAALRRGIGTIRRVSTRGNDHENQPLALATAFALSSTVALAQAGGAAGTGGAGTGGTGSATSGTASPGTATPGTTTGTSGCQHQ